MSNIIFTDDAFGEVLRQARGRHAIIVTDTNVRRLWLSDIALPVITIEAGEEHKTLGAVEHVWQQMIALGATRRSLIINIGGGMVTDLGGFAAATFKRGVEFVNVPTTVLGAVDAAVGGKTGFDYQGLKNEIGVFAEASTVVVSAQWFATLPPEQLLSGYGEMLKHALLDGEEAVRQLLDEGTAVTLDTLRRNIAVKTSLTAIDPTEQGPRRALNLGHTFGHALEEMLLERNMPRPHGHCVAWGLAVALVLSRMQERIDSGLLHTLSRHIRDTYGTLPLECADYDRVLNLMHHDKKNRGDGRINFTLLDAPGQPRTDVLLDDDTIKAAIDIARDLL